MCQGHWRKLRPTLRFSKLESNIDYMTLINMKQPLFWTKLNSVHMRLWHYAKIEWFDFSLLFRGLRAAVFTTLSSPFYYISSGTQNTSIHLYSSRTYTFNSATQFPLPHTFLISDLFNPFLFSSSLLISFNHWSFFCKKSRVGNHFSE